MGDADCADEDRRLLKRAEEALTEIKIAQGLSEPQEDVLAALRIRLKGDPGKSLEDLLAAAEDSPGGGFDELLARPDDEPAASLDDLFSKADKPKRSLDDLL